ncbi:MAG: phosphate ABC transporter permease PstA [Xanthomonadales bacterium]|nr:phosphate ABC transporter permease PstA [Gammaproteobacteria bacterium]NNK05372.1 phosphate ABC transporter permease PstA [Xanthomonadales bacterium]
MKALTRWIADGTPWVWLNAAAVAASILLVTGLLLLIGIRGVGHFWPLAVHQIVYQEADGTEVVVTGQIRERETVTATRLRESGLEVAEGTELVHRDLLKTGNRDVTGQDFRWILEPSIQSMSRPRSMVVLEREEWGVFIGMLIGVREAGQLLESPDTWGDFQSRLERANELRDEIRELEKNRIGSVNYRLERLRLKQRGLELKGKLDAENLADIESDRALLQEEYRGLEQELVDLYSKLQLGAVVVTTGDGKELELPMSTIVDAHRPNQMGLAGKIGHFFHNCWKFVTEDPREANTEGGIFPSIFGTVLLVLLMSVFVTPLGVVAAVYLKEYARQGMFTRFIRVAVNNLAGVPSIVYGVFGLGFFVYTLGGSLDRLFYPEALPAPTFGTGGLFWASLTLALLTLPVVIVSTEEGLSRIPRSIREGSLALGATQWETLWRTVLPMASPGIMTGLILAVARAAGEVAPLMLVGVVKLAPALPLDGNWPFLHLDRKFMHLGFHIYDVGFQSPNVEAARPLVYATALLLVVVIVLLNLVAIRVRNRLSEKYRGLES